VEEDGRTRLRDRFIVSAPVSGRLLRLGLRAGDMVAQDQPLGVIRAAPSALLGPRERREAEERLGRAEAMLEQAGALLERALAEHAQAVTDAGRVRALHQRGATPRQQLERAELAETVAARELVAAERRRHAAAHELAQARAVLASADGAEPPRERRELRAPVAGRVLRVLQESEAVVAAGAPLLELGDPAALEVVADILTTEAVGIMPGAPVAIERWGGPAALQGRVRRVEPGAYTRVSALGVEEPRVWVVIELLDPPQRWAALGDVFRVDVRITRETVEDAVLAPVSALFRRGAGWAVFVVAEGVARERRVEAGRHGAQHAVIEAGLTPGEQVVPFPPGALRDGLRVRRAP
jgi:HlyD family secretion protein